ncbi:MAG TPA: multiheme c-type cytochrome [Allosphingosinicella sp.]|nr:multiheme c-type cytochrome [Allosphingosinicella sp.]
MEDKLGGSRKLAIGLCALGALAVAALFLLFKPHDAQAVQSGVSVAPGNFVGVATCGGTTCHGRSQGDGPRVRQDEIMLWQDPATAAGAHSRAYAVLREPRSRAIAERLGIGEATGAPMCLGCHATPAGPRGVRFQTTDGVGCESCHGAASGWLTSHYAVGGTHAANVRNGLVPLDDARARAERCLNCHFGSDEAPNQFVTHRIMAAGHPRISFELDLFTTLQQHYNIDDDYRERGKNLATGTQVWATGQAMALERSLRLFVSQRGTEGIFPEFYFFDCHSCHRQISDDPRFRPGSVPNPGRPIPSGMPPYNDENMIMLDAAARVVAPGLARQFERDSRAFHQAMGEGRQAAIAAANRLRATLRQLANAFAGADMGRNATFAIIDTITSQAISPRFTDYAGSVQAVMATDTLLSALVSGGHVPVATANAIRRDINGAYRAVHDPNAYDPGGFRASLGRAAAAIRRLR